MELCGQLPSFGWHALPHIMMAATELNQFGRTLMNLPSEIVSQVFALPVDQRYELAQQLLESIDDPSLVEFDEPILTELRRRREEMLRGEQIVPDWRAVLAEIDNSLD
jgi:hypothetical protein